MPRKTITKASKPTLVRAGNHFLDPADVACVSKIKGRNLYIIRLKSQPNMEYPIWVNEEQANEILQHFNIKMNDEEME